jgi:hypothetical protein
MTSGPEGHFVQEFRFGGMPLPDRRGGIGRLEEDLRIREGLGVPELKK